MTSKARERSVRATPLALLLVSVSLACEASGSPGPADPRADAASDLRTDVLGERTIDCVRWRTVKEMDAFFRQRCGGEDAACHATNAFGSNFREPNVFARLLTTPSLACPGTNLADGTDHTRGAIWAKTRDRPACAAGSNSGRSAGPRMPSDPGVSLTAEEKACLESFLTALTR